MFTPKGLIIGSITNSIVDYIKMENLKAENVILPRKIFKTASTDYATFYLDNNIFSIEEVMTDYKFDDVRPSDIVLDIGSNIGGFCLSVYKKVSRVYAVEPLYIGTLSRNIELNCAKNIELIPCALGSGEMNISYNGQSTKALGLSLGSIINLCGGHIDFLKCDCEGGEWSITLPEIMNIRRIEAEIHNLDGSHNFRDFEKLLVSAGFDYTKTYRKDIVMLISAKNRYIE